MKKYQCHYQKYSQKYSQKYTTPTDRGRTGLVQIQCFKHHVHVLAHGQHLTAHQTQLAVVVQYLCQKTENNMDKQHEQR
jgi:hypothetical protein